MRFYDGVGWGLGQWNDELWRFWVGSFVILDRRFSRFGPSWNLALEENSKVGKEVV